VKVFSFPPLFLTFFLATLTRFSPICPAAGFKVPPLFLGSSWYHFFDPLKLSTSPLPLPRPNRSQGPLPSTAISFFSLRLTSPPLGTFSAELPTNGLFLIFFLTAKPSLSRFALVPPPFYSPDIRYRFGSKVHALSFSMVPASTQFLFSKHSLFSSGLSLDSTFSLLNPYYRIQWPPFAVLHSFRFVRINFPKPPDPLFSRNFGFILVSFSSSLFRWLLWLFLQKPPTMKCHAPVLEVIPGALESSFNPFAFPSTACRVWALFSFSLFTIFATLLSKPFCRGFFFLHFAGRVTFFNPLSPLIYFLFVNVPFPNVITVTSSELPFCFPDFFLHL